MNNGELRMGNWVECQSTATDSIYHKVTGITEENIFLDAITFDYLTLEDIEPIPLTEEILLKCGFYKEDKDKNRFYNETLDIEVEFHGNKIAFIVCDVECPHCTHFIMHCEYLHEFQNNVFSLTGQELEINL